MMCSALHQQELMVEALEAGAQDFVVKPFVPEKVLEAVRKVARLDRRWAYGCWSLTIRG